MAIAPTRFSRVSIGWVSSDESLVDRDAADSGIALSATGGFAFGVGSGKSAADAAQPGEIVFSGTHLYVGDSSGSFLVIDASALTQ